MTDSEWIAQIAAGDEDAFRLLVTRFQNRVFSTAFSFVQLREDAEDVAQEVFIEVHRAAGKWRGESSVSTWIYRITVNRSLDHLRSRQRKKRKGILRSLFVGESVEPRFEVSHSEHPGQQLERSETAAILRRHIDQLPERQKAAFILHKIEGLSLKETGSALGVSEGAVESLLSRGTVALRKALENFYEEYRRNRD